MADDMASEGLGRPGSARAPVEVSHNLAGQRLGRKGQETRERILTAMLRLLEDPAGPVVTMSSVAREAQVRLTNLYLYFPDFTELLLATLERVTADADAAFVAMLRARWPDSDLGERCLAFIKAYYRFWAGHARVLHLRNTTADADARVAGYRQNATRPLIGLLAAQMTPQGREPTIDRAQMASVVLTGFERVATVMTNPHVIASVEADGLDQVDTFVERMLWAQARLVELAIRDQRSTGQG